MKWSNHMIRMPFFPALFACALIFSLGSANAADVNDEKMSMPAIDGKFFATKIATNDLGSIVKFYTEVIGMKKIGAHQDDNGVEALLTFGGENGPLLMPMQYSDDRKVEVGTAYGPLVFEIPDVEAVCEKIVHFGGKITQKPKSYPDMGMVIAMAADPDGRPIEIIQMRTK